MQYVRIVPVYYVFLDNLCHNNFFTSTDNLYDPPPTQNIWYISLRILVYQPFLCLSVDIYLSFDMLVGACHRPIYRKIYFR